VRDLLTSGWQETSFVSDTSAIFVYALLSHCVDEYRHLCVDELRTLVHVCLYLSYTYVGSEISYPLRPFIRGCCGVGRATQNYGQDDEVDDADDDDDDDDDDVVINHACPGTETGRSWSSVASSRGSDDDVSDDCRQRFWTCCVSVVDRCSRLMLRLNADSELYARVYRQLTSYCPTPRAGAVHPSVCREP